LASGSPTSARERALVRWAYPNSYPMMSEAKIRAAGSSVGKNSTVQSQSVSSCQYGWNHPCGSFSRATDLQFRLLTSKLAVQGRYNQKVRLSVSSCSLQGIAERPLPCNYNVIQFVYALSRRKRGFKSRRGRQFNGLQENRLLSV
jgi:hypothetical protein